MFHSGHVRNHSFYMAGHVTRSVPVQTRERGPPLAQAEISFCTIVSNSSSISRMYLGPFWVSEKPKDYISR